MILELWNNWKDEPVTVTFKGESTKIDMIPFPAVTICTSQKMTSDKVNIEKMKSPMNHHGYMSHEFNFNSMSTKE